MDAPEREPTVNTGMARFLFAASLACACTSTGQGERAVEQTAPQTSIARSCEPCALRTIATASFAYEVAMDESAVYWVSDEGLVTAPRAGGEPRVLLREASHDGLAISRDAAFVCRVGEGGPRSVERVPKSGGEAVAVAEASDCELGVVGDHLYFPVLSGDRDRLARVPLHGGPVETLGSPTLPISQIIGDATHVYWRDDGAIRRYSLADDGVESFVDAPGWGPITLTATHLVWAQGSTPGGATVLCAPKHGDRGAITIATGQKALDLTSDGSRVVWTDQHRWVRWDPATPATIASFAVPESVTSIAIDGTTVAFNRFARTGRIDIIDTCGCGPDVLSPDPPRP